MKVKDGIIGLIVGDALGVPVEFNTRYELEKNPVTTMRGYGTYNQPPGTWSDDSSMTIATMASIINENGIKLEKIMEEFCEWIFNSKYTQYDHTFDFGRTTQRALLNYEHGMPAEKCGGNSERDNGNGSLMRILPLAFLKNIDDKTIEDISSLTHAHERSRITCVYYIEIAKSMLYNNDLTIAEHIENANRIITEKYKNNEELKNFKRIFTNDFTDGISSSGYVIDTIECVIYCLRTTKSYKESVLKAVNLGGDTDTIAAICGGLAGIYHGFDEIPNEWIEQIPKITEIISLCEKYEMICNEY